MTYAKGPDGGAAGVDVLLFCIVYYCIQYALFASLLFASQWQMSPFSIFRSRSAECELPVLTILCRNI